MLGENGAVHSIGLAKKLAVKVEHPDVEWFLRSVGNVRLMSELSSLLLRKASEEDDPRTLTFAALLNGKGKCRLLLQRAAEMGYAFAQYRFGRMTSQEEWMRKV